jgi:hypothetical protein
VDFTGRILESLPTGRTYCPGIEVVNAGIMRGFQIRTQATRFREASMFFELRQYKIRPGKQAAWIKLMEEEILPFQISQGMVIQGSWVGEEDDSIYYWMRRFTDEAERERLYEAVYQSDTWKNDIGPRIPDLMDRDAMQVTRITATPKSVIQ